MIRHFVLVRFKPETTPEQRRRLFRRIADLEPRLPGCIAVHAGANVSPELGMDQGFSDAFTVDFVDAESRDAYLADAEHRRIGAEIVALALGGRTGVLVFDLSMDELDAMTRRG